jgi:hypothetical protein
MLLHGRAQGGETGGDRIAHWGMLAGDQWPFHPSSGVSGLNQNDELSDAISQWNASAAKMPNFQHGCFP